MADTLPTARAEVRFPFGKNWARFLRNVDDGVILRAQQSLTEMLGCDDLAGRRFLDIGSGSGLFSLAARQLGASVVSFDYDPHSVGCTAELKRRYRNGDDQWSILRGSALDRAFIASLRRFDIVYAWGVLHHTGDMWTALDLAGMCVGPGGLLYTAIYNDQGGASRRWTRIKRLYNRLPRALRPAVLLPALVRIWGPITVRDVLRGRPLESWRTYPQVNRGMDPWCDLIDWVGGYPFEVAKPEQIFDFYRARGMELRRLRTRCGGRGCNEFVFERIASPA